MAHFETDFASQLHVQDNSLKNLMLLIQELVSRQADPSDKVKPSWKELLDIPELSQWFCSTVAMKSTLTSLNNNIAALWTEVTSLGHAVSATAPSAPSSFSYNPVIPPPDPLSLGNVPSSSVLGKRGISDIVSSTGPNKRLQSGSTLTDAPTDVHFGSVATDKDVFKIAKAFVAQGGGGTQISYHRYIWKFWHLPRPPPPPSCLIWQFPITCLSQF